MMAAPQAGPMPCVYPIHFPVMEAGTTEENSLGDIAALRKDLVELGSKIERARPGSDRRRSYQAWRGSERRALAARTALLRGKRGNHVALERWRWVTAVQAHRWEIPRKMSELQGQRDELAYLRACVADQRWRPRTLRDYRRRIAWFEQERIPELERYLQALFDLPVQPYREWWRAAQADRPPAPRLPRPADRIRGIVSLVGELPAMMGDHEDEFLTSSHYDRWMEEFSAIVEDMKAKLAEGLTLLRRPWPDDDDWLRQQLEGLDGGRA